jgi:hypothetical protein
MAKTAAWQRKEGKSPSGGLNKNNPKGKRAARKKSFCARMSGVKGPMKDENGKPTRKALALRKWNCK